MGKNHGQYNVSGVLFSDVFKRLVDSKIIKTQADLARILKFARGTITNAKDNNSIPVRWKRRFENEGFNLNWVFFGDGEIYNSKYIYFNKHAYLARKIAGITKDRVVKFYKLDKRYPISRYFVEHSNLSEKNIGYFVQPEDDLYNSSKKGDAWIIDCSKNIVTAGNFYLLKIENRLAVKKVTSASALICFKVGGVTSRIEKHNAMICGQCVAKFAELGTDNAF